MSTRNDAAKAVAQALWERGRMTCEFHGVPDDSGCIYCAAEWGAITEALAAARPYIRRDMRYELEEQLLADWADACSGHRNPDVCETCRTYDATIKVIRRAP